MPLLMENEELTLKQKIFLNEYVKDFNGKQAAIRAGYKESAAEVRASKLLAQDKVQQALQAKLDQINAKTEATVEDVRKFWLETMLDENSNKSDRLRASELIAKDKGIFTQNTANIAIFNGLQSKDLAFLDDKVRQMLDSKIVSAHISQQKQLPGDDVLDEEVQ